MKRMITASVILLAMIFASCGGTAVSVDTTAAENNASSVAETTESYDYPTLDCKGETFRMLNTAQTWYFYTSLDFDTLTGETVDDAIYERNRTLEEKFNFKLEVDEQYKFADAMTALQKSVTAGDDIYDVAFSLQRYASTVLSGGYLMDMDKIDGFRFDEAWWDSTSNRELQIGSDRKQLMAFSDISLATFEGSLITFINEDMANDFNVALPYDLVRNGDWTYAEMRKLMKAGANLNGDSDFTYTADGSCIYGLASFNAGENGLFMSGNGRYYSVDKTGTPQFEADSATCINIAQKLIETLSNDGEYICYNRTSDDNFETIFKQGRSLLMIGELKAANLFRDMKDSYGILPLPKIDKSQENYRNKLSVGYLMCVPVTCDTPERTAVIMDAMSFLTYRDVMPQYYHGRISQKSLRNEDSIEMLELIRETRCFDIGFIYGWSEDIYTIIHDAIANKSTDITSQIAAVKSTCVGKIEQVLKAMN